MAAQTIELPAKPRHALGKQVKALRRQGRVPGVVYGRGFDSLPIEVEAHDLQSALAHGGRRGLVELKIEGQRPMRVLMRDVRRHVTTGRPLHIDLLRVSATEKLRAPVPVVLQGEAPAVKVHGGVLQHHLNQIEVECLPDQFPTHFVVDVSNLTELHDMVRVKDLTCPPGVTILSDQDEAIVNVSASRAAAAAAAEEEAAAATAAPAPAPAEGEQAPAAS